MDSIYSNSCTFFPCVRRVEFKKLERKVRQLESQVNSIQEYTFPTLHPFEFRPLPGTLYFIASIYGAGGGGGLPSGPPFSPVGETWNLGGGGGGGSFIEGQFTISNPEHPPTYLIAVGEGGSGAFGTNQKGETGGSSSVSQFSTQGILQRRLIARGGIWWRRTTFTEQQSFFCRRTWSIIKF